MEARQRLEIVIGMIKTIEAERDAIDYHSFTAMWNTSWRVGLSLLARVTMKVTAMLQNMWTGYYTEQIPVICPSSARPSSL